jgi:hypothetical protein
MPERRPRPAGVRGSTIDVGGWVSQGCASNITRREAKEREQGCTRGHARTSVLSRQLGNVVGRRQNLSITMRTTAANNCPRSTMQQLAPVRPVSNRFCADDRRPKADGVLSRSYSVAFQYPRMVARVPDDPPIWPRPFLSFHGLLNAITRHRGALPGPGFRLEIRPPRVSKT